MNKVVLTINTNMWHFAQVVTGFLLLKKEGIVDLEIKYGSYIQWTNILHATINGVPVAYDLSDSSTIDEPNYAKVAVYFKRMCVKAVMATHPKLQPLGFNYLVYTNSWDFFKINNRLLPVFKKIGLQRLRYLPILPSALKLEDSIDTCNYENFETNNTDRPFVIQFSCRLWGNTKEIDNDPLLLQERAKVSEDRIKLVRNLKASFDGLYFGGIQDGPIARELAPDLILDNKNYEKKTYIDNLKNSSIGIITPGLEDSIGWKFGEYVAAGLAIFSTPEFLKFALPGDFKEGENFIVFDSNEACIEKIKLLQQDKAALTKIMAANIQYYKNYLRPDKLVMNTINTTKQMVKESVKTGQPLIA